jgi:hypothetical protein
LLRCAVIYTALLLFETDNEAVFILRITSNVFIL